MRNEWMSRRELLFRGGAVAAAAVGANLAFAEEQEKRDQLDLTVKVEAEPYEFVFTPASTALVIIDMQRDFVMPGGFGELLGNDVNQVRPAIEPTRRVLEAWRKKGLQVLHTREGHRPDLSDCPPSKKARGKLKVGIGDRGPMGRVLVRGEYGHDIIDELKPLSGEPIIDKPGKGAFFATDLELILRNRGVRSLIMTGVTTEVCVQTTAREANDRGFECLVLEDCVGSYFPEFHRVALEMIKAQGGIVGWVSNSAKLLRALGR
jgi:nicotinamidase-related amidase